MEVIQCVKFIITLQMRSYYSQGQKGADREGGRVGTSLCILEMAQE